MYNFAQKIHYILAKISITWYNYIYIKFLSAAVLLPQKILKRGVNMLEFKFDTQLLIEGENLSEDDINDYFRENFKGDCLLAVGDEDLIKIHFHTNEPWKVLEYCASLGEIYDVVIENMERQEHGLKG